MLSLSSPPRKSLLSQLGGIILIIVVTLFGLHSAYTYTSQRDRMLEAMRLNASQSIASLQKNLAPFIEAYAVNDYENLVATELELRHHQAIVIEDYRLAAILGKSGHITGKLRTQDGRIVDFNVDDPAHRREIEQSFRKESGLVQTASGETIGRIAVHDTNTAMKRELRRALAEQLFTTVLTILALIALLSYAIHRLFVRPLSQIAKVIEHCDGDGLPIEQVPDFGYSEIATLTDAMNISSGVARHARDVLQIERSRLQNVIDGTGAGTWEWNIQTGETVFNARWADIVGYRLEELAPVSIDTWQKLAHPDDRARSEEALKLHFSGELPYYECEARMRHKDGHWVWVLDRGRVTSRDEHGHPVWMFGTHTDITFLKEHQRQLEYIARYDTLTGLPNRALLADRLQQAMLQTARRHGMLALIYLDLDGFKAVNDRHGHEVGDKLLVHLSRQMKTALRDGDTLARLGGDEFVAILLDLKDPEDCQPVVERLLRTASETILIDDLELRVSASLGVAYYPQSEEIDPDQLLRQADQAMYQAKQAGKNRSHLFDPENERSLRNRHENIHRIQTGLENDEFVLYYQPKVNMRTGETVGVEALIRWQHPERGMLSPAAFLPMVTNHVLTIDIGKWVLKTALNQIEAWRAIGRHVPVSINIEALHLQRTDFVEHLAEELSQHPGVVPGDLQLEVLETVALDDFALISEVMRGCQEQGVSFALDDFGTGYSSLTYLRRLPVQQIKIDQSFVRDMLDDPDDLAILEGVLGLGSAFRLDIIAEGVETLEHGQTLLRMGCELGQGYAIARPMPAEAIPGWLSTWQPDPEWRNCPPLARENIAVLFALVEHRAWLRRLENHLHNEASELPPLHADQCRLGKWLGHQGNERYANHPDMVRILALHDKVHDNARRIIDLQRTGQYDAAQARVTELKTLGDSLQQGLLQLLN